ncbi:AAA domain-containing protein [Bacterioplanoides sp. SCSIO 12839]|uniref:AAA domain-containing protein n=1 Tax=Bacterioplanoides sp. SCSIO 12839 TaxID=2829569 RepID=UPI0021068E31|nr:AAA domain-containing protein [Bacterioplanoides sp. SCSIO 12839]UTW49814.1 AAA family ATPase [Bacterioplanoides sp. SCSIO 12839]
MDNPFFTALEGSAFDASELANQTIKVLTPFRHYLENSIKALESKEVSCLWKPLANKSYRLIPTTSVWKVTPISEIVLSCEKQGWFEIISVDGEVPDQTEFMPELEDPVIAGKGSERLKFEIGGEGFRKEDGRFEIYLPDLADHRVIQWSGYQLEVRPLVTNLSDITSVEVDGHSCKVTGVRDQQLTVEGYISANSRVTIDGQAAVHTVSISIRESDVERLSHRKDGNGWLVFSKNKPKLTHCEISDVTARQLGTITVDYLKSDNGKLQKEDWSLIADQDRFRLEALGTASLNEDQLLTSSRLPGLCFKVEPRGIEEKWIQLIEKETAGDESGRSDLDYFFGDNQNIKILDSSQRKHDDGYRVVKAKPEERQLLLARNVKGKKNWKSEYPSANKKNELRVSVDTSQLKRQKEAINQLMSRPKLGYAPLIQLLQDRKSTAWESFEPRPEGEIKWRVLTDPNFDGCNRQREFVAKALVTPDFAILDGPPGTGKTTTILELIMQLVLDGKRVLLSASTHAAINNVLERIKENNELSSRIFPLRVGNENNAIGVEEYQFDNVLETLQKAAGCQQISKQLMVDSSNLVCGTTIGILRLFNDRDITLDRGEPPFDVMIIDECSKTTFQEFLVPARFAKRWVLVGDVKQLSPFTDREQIIANLDDLMLKPPRGKAPAETLPKEVQQACFLLEELRGHRNKPYQQPMLVPVTSSTLSALNHEVRARLKDSELNAGLENILLIGQRQRRKSGEELYIDVNEVEQSPKALYQSNLCFVDENVLSIIQSLIPDDMLVVHPNWSGTCQAFQHRLRGADTQKPFSVKTSDYSNTVDIHNQLLDRLNTTKWSEEVCWRLEREYWLRLSKNYDKKTRTISNTLKRLFPKSIDADGRIHILKDIAFPSILEALSGDGLAKRRKDEPTTLNQGLSDVEKQQRHSTLNYQHRMHPDISGFPRQQFYKKGELSDGSRTEADRAWGYSRFRKRNIWLDVSGSTYRNANDKEVKSVIRELKAFCDWAEGKKKNDKQEPYDVAILTFYKGQEKALREALQQLPGNKSRYARFVYKGIAIKLATVDYFQGQEADVVFLSMVNTKRDGFMDSPNRLNVSITRARYQMVVVGHHKYFREKSWTEELRELAKSAQVECSK